MRQWGLLLLAGLGCGAEPVAGPETLPECPPSYWVTIGPGGATVAVGDTVRMVVSHNIPPELGSIRTEWEVSNASVDVDSWGLVRGKAVGSAGVRVRIILGTATTSRIATVHVR